MDMALKTQKPGEGPRGDEGLGGWLLFLKVVESHTLSPLPNPQSYLRGNSRGLGAAQAQAQSL